MEIEVSVCILTYNHEKYVKQAIESLINQKTNFEYEILVFDDCSTDNTIKMIEDHYNNQVKIYCNDENKGISRNLYNAVTVAKGNYIAVMAGDDYAISEKYLQKQYDYLQEHNNCVAVSHWVKMITEDGQECGKIETQEKVYKLDQYLWDDNVPVRYASMMKNVFKQPNLEWLYETSAINDEAQFKFFLLMNGNIGIIHEYLSIYRYVESGGSNYNSKYDAIDTLVEKYHTYEYLKKNVGEKCNFKFCVRKKGVDALRFCVWHIIKKRNVFYIRKLVKQIGMIHLFTIIYTVPILWLGKGEYPQWYRKIHKIY